MAKNKTNLPKSQGGNLSPIQKGEVRNPNGRPKGSRNRAAIYRDLLDAAMAGNPDKTNADGVVAALLAAALNSDVAAAKELMDSGYGKVSDKSEVSITELVIRDMNAERKSKKKK